MSGEDSGARPAGPRRRPPGFRLVFADALAEDAQGDAVKCLNCDAEISFDSIEGRRALQGRRVADALEDLRDFALEAIAYLNIPEIDSQENERADRH